MGRSDDFIQLKGTISEALPNATFRVKLETGHLILAHVSGRMRKNFIRLLPGDKVLVEISKYDPKKGRIIYRFSR
ncbi:MAG: translation initiation factor IF-1 [Candidatus Aminicenantes bacterium]|nr:translation initiation factor IF-1 [Candidatus Aminicenantes bacterium]